MINDEDLIGFPGSRRCPSCEGTELRNKGLLTRKVRHVSWAVQRVWLILEGRRWLCRDCGVQLRERFPGLPTTPARHGSAGGYRPSCKLPGGIALGCRDPCVGESKLHGPGRRTGKLELYDSGRYFTIIGQQLWNSSVRIGNRQSQVEELLSDLVTSQVITPAIANRTILFTSDQELIERAKLAKNGDRFARLWAGDTSDFCGDHSRADLALSHAVVLVQG